MQQGGKSMITAIPADYHLKDISNQYEKMLLEIGFHGMIMIEIKEFENQFYMIEANPRIWGPSQLFVDANVNLFEHFLVDYGLLENTDNIKKTSKCYNKEVKYMWSQGITDGLSMLKYHDDYSKERFIEDFESFLEWDIYNRRDTDDLFKKKGK